MAALIDDLEYHLKFPLITEKDFTQGKEEDNFVFFYNDEKLPLVILFGWAGCQDKYLAKYSEIYENKGCITLRCTTPAVVTFLRHDKLKKLGQKLLDVLHETSLDEHPIFFHIFSNGGAFFYQNVSLLLQKSKIDLEVKGVIFDSAPGERRFSSVYRALRTIIGGSAWCNIPLSIVLSLFSFVVFFVVAFAKAILEIRWPQTDPIILADEPFKWPQLFIYSKDDELVKYEDIERFASKRERKGVIVKRVCFLTSPHVQHLLKHREEYIKAVMEFLHECLNSSKKAN